MRRALPRTALMTVAALWAAPLTAQAGDSVPRDTLSPRFPALANRAVIIKINRLFRF